MSRFLFIILTVSFPFLKAFSQPVLPDIAGATERGINVLTWASQYDGIKSIAVQRSADSTFNYATIGYVKKTGKGPQAFVDGHPLPGNNWYRLYIVFNSDLTWYSNRVKVHVDSNDLLAKGVVPPTDSLQAMADKILENSDTIEGSSFTFIKSQYIFTNPFTGHVNMELPDVRDHFYTIYFYNQSDKKVLEIPRVRESPAILDKRNFKSKGIYKFDLVRDGELLETGHVTIY